MERRRERKGRGGGEDKGSAIDPRKRIRFVECQLEEGRLSRDLNTGSITVN